MLSGSSTKVPASNPSDPSASVKEGGRRRNRSRVLHDKTKEDIQKTLDQQSPIFDPELDNVQPQDRQLVESYMLREIEKTVIQGIFT